MGSRRRLLCAFVILVWVGVFATLVMLIYAGWLPQDGAVRLELSACLESSVTPLWGWLNSCIAGRS